MTSSRAMNKQGFTLIELITSIALLLIIGAFAANFITSILRSYNKAQIINEIEQNGNYVLTLMESQIRNARSVSPTGTATNTLTITTQDGTPITYEIVPVGGIGVVRRTSNGSANILTNDDPVDGVSVVTGESQFIVSNTTPPTVKIILKLKQAPKAPGRVDYKAETVLQNTVVVRGGYE